MCDRTGFVDNDKGFLFAAQRHFPKTIAKLKDIDILILAIGTNDLQFKYNLTFNRIESGLENLIVTAKKYANRILLIPPVILSNNILEGAFKYQFDETSVSKSKKIHKIYQKLSKVYGLEYFDFNEFIKPSVTDGLHYDEIGHQTISDRLYNYITLKSSTKIS